MKKNAILTITWMPDDYPSTCVTFSCNEDSTADELLQYFVRFLKAAGYYGVDELLNV